MQLSVRDAMNTVTTVMRTSVEAAITVRTVQKEAAGVQTAATVVTA